VTYLRYGFVQVRPRFIYDRPAPLYDCSQTVQTFYARLFFSEHFIWCMLIDIDILETLSMMLIYHHRHHHHRGKIYSAPITWRTLQESLTVVNSNHQTLKAKLKKCVVSRFLKSTESETARMSSSRAFHAQAQREKRRALHILSVAAASRSSLLKKIVGRRLND